MSDNSNGNGSALDRYMQKNPGAAPGAAPSVVPTAPQASPGFGGGSTVTALNLNISSTPDVAFAPAGFWIRFCAAIVDAIIINIVSRIAGLGIGIVVGLAFAGSTVMGTIAAIAGGGVGLAVGFFYFAWFYKAKGATPGKMLLGLKTLNAETGTHLTYGQTFVREMLAKPFLSAIFTLTIGYWLAGIREDKKALHDLVCSTRVVRNKKA
jgi:uncharacterized RDD family membrane protein YckC